MKKQIKSPKASNYVINPLTSKELLGFLDEKSKDIIKYFIIKSLFSQPEPKVGQKQLPIQIPKEHIEQWFTQSLNIKLAKNGDVTNNDSGEAPLGQKFEGPGINLDAMFKANKYEDIKDQWANLYTDKYKS